MGFRRGLHARFWPLAAAKNGDASHGRPHKARFRHMRVPFGVLWVGFWRPPRGAALRTQITPGWAGEDLEPHTGPGESGRTAESLGSIQRPCIFRFPLHMLEDEHPRATRRLCSDCSNCQESGHPYPGPETTLLEHHMGGLDGARGRTAWVTPASTHTWQLQSASVLNCQVGLASVARPAPMALAQHVRGRVEVSRACRLRRVPKWHRRRRGEGGASR